MKHKPKIIVILILMFIVSQLIGLAVIGFYSPTEKQVIIDGNSTNVISYNLPYGVDPPESQSPGANLISILISIFVAVVIILVLMKIKAEIFLRLWFFIVVIFALAVTLNAAFHFFTFSYLIAIAIAVPLTIMKVFRRNIFVHNVTELMIYPGIAAIFVPLLNIWGGIILLAIISAYDIYAVWHAKFMVKMAKFQLERVKVFGGFFIPFISKRQRKLIFELRKKGKSLKNRKIKIGLAILGGGDVAWPMIFMGIVLHYFGLLSAFIILIGAILSLLGLFIFGKKDKAYPAMPYLTAGCLIALGIVYLIRFLS